MTKLEEYIETCARLSAIKLELMLDFGQPAKRVEVDRMRMRILRLGNGMNYEEH
jgi:hypothetical protein